MCYAIHSKTSLKWLTGNTCSPLLLMMEIEDFAWVQILNICIIIGHKLFWTSARYQGKSDASPDVDLVNSQIWKLHLQYAEISILEEDLKQFEKLRTTKLLPPAVIDRFILQLLFIRKVLFFITFYSFLIQYTTATSLYTPPSLLPTSTLLQIHCFFISCQKREAQPPVQQTSGMLIEHSITRRFKTQHKHSY